MFGIFGPSQTKSLLRTLRTLRANCCFLVNDPLRGPQGGVVRVVHPEQFALVLTAVRHAHERRLQGQSMLRIDRCAIEAQEVEYRVRRDVMAIGIAVLQEGSIVDMYSIAHGDVGEAQNVRVAPAITEEQIPAGVHGIQLPVSRLAGNDAYARPRPISVTDSFYFDRDRQVIAIAGGSHQARQSS